MSTQATTAVQKNDPEKGIEFIPYGAADKIKLSVKIIQNMVAVPTKSGKTCSERDALRFLMLCQAQRLNPFAGDAFLVGYDTQNGPQFSLITAHQAFLKRAETCSDFEGMESGVILLTGDDENPTTTEREGDFHLETEKVIGGWARVHRKGRKDTYRRIRMSRFNNGFAQWKVDPAGMIVKCAEADALRSTFPTLLGGLYIQGEVNEGANRIVSQMSANRTSFEAPSRLVETLPAPSEQTEEQAARAHDAQHAEGTDLGPQTAKGQPTTTAAAIGPVTELEQFVTGQGYTFDQLQKVGMETGLVDGADSLSGFADISVDNAKRLLRAKAGLLQKLKAVKEGAA